MTENELDRRDAGSYLSSLVRMCGRSGAMRPPQGAMGVAVIAGVWRVPSPGPYGKLQDACLGCLGGRECSQQQFP